MTLYRALYGQRGLQWGAWHDVQRGIVIGVSNPVCPAFLNEIGPSLAPNCLRRY